MFRISFTGLELRERSTLLVDRGIGVGSGREDRVENWDPVFDALLESVDRVEKPEDVGVAEVEYDVRWNGVEGADGEGC